MTEILKRKVDLFVLFLLLLLILPRFYRIDGGLVLGEPDEYIHQGVAEGFKHSAWPEYSGTPWFFQMPLYPFLGFILSTVFPQKYVALRMISVISSILLILGTYIFFRRQFSRRIGLLSALLLVFSPFSIYISRLALLDSTAVSFGMLSVYAFETAWKEGSKKWAFFSGLFLATALMVKYTALVYFLVPLAFSAYSLVKENRSEFTRKNYIKVNLISAIPVLVVLAVTLPLLYLMRQHDPHFFKLQTLTSLGFIRDFWRIKGGELNILIHLKNIPWWLTWPVLGSFPVGLVLLIRNGFKKCTVLVLGLFLTAIIVLPFRPFYPRYFYPLIPFAAILSAFALDFIASRINYRQRALLYLLTFVLIAPTSIEAFRSTNHSLIETAGAYVEKSSLKTGKSDPWLFTNYWPNIIGEAGGTKRSTWLTSSAWDAGAFVPGIPEAPTTILEKEGGFVLLEELYSHSKILIHPPQRTDAWTEVQSKYEPERVIYDNAPNFPHFSKKINKITIYRVKPK